MASVSLIIQAFCFSHQLNTAEITNPVVQVKHSSAIFNYNNNNEQNVQENNEKYHKSSNSSTSLCTYCSSKREAYNIAAVCPAILRTWRTRYTTRTAGTHFTTTMYTAVACDTVRLVTDTITLLNKSRFKQWFYI